MKLLLGSFALLLIALSLFADYKWKRWIAARKRGRDPDQTSSRSR